MATYTGFDSLSRRKTPGKTAACNYQSPTRAPLYPPAHLIVLMIPREWYYYPYFIEWGWITNTKKDEVTCPLSSTWKWKS